MATIVGRAWPPVGEQIAFVVTANGLAMLIADSEAAGAGEAPPTATVATQTASAAVDTGYVAAKLNRTWGLLMYDGTGELKLTLNGRAATLTDYDISLQKGDVLPLKGRTLAIRGIEATANGFVHLYEELGP